MAFGDFGFVLFELLLSDFAQSFPFEANLVLFSTCRQLYQSIDELIKAAGFEFATLEKNYFDGPRFISYHYVGQAHPN